MNTDQDYKVGTNYFFFVVLLDFHKLDEWEVIIESDLRTMEWEDSEDSEGKNF